jgi:hypothetical protein
MADWRRPDASCLINAAGGGEGVALPNPLSCLDVQEQLELPERHVPHNHQLDASRNVAICCGF